MKVSFAVFCFACGMLCLAIAVTVLGSVGSVLCRGIAALRAVLRAMGVMNCSCFAPEIATLKSCCCPLNGPKSAPHVTAQAGASDGTALRDGGNPMFGSWRCVKAELSGKSVSEYTGHELTIPGNTGGEHTNHPPPHLYFISRGRRF